MESTNNQLTLLQQAYDEHPDDRVTALNLAQQYSDQGWYNEALDIFHAVLDRYPEDVTLLLEYGNTAFKKGDIKTAVGLFGKLARLRPERIEGWNNLGIAKVREDDRDGAFEAFSRVLELEPDNPGALLNMGNILFEQGNFDDARLHFERACSARADFPDAWFNLGNTLIELEQYGEARSAFEKALRYRREFPSALKNLGWINELEHRYEDAWQCYSDAIQLNKADARLHVNLGNVNIHLRKYDEAKKCFLKAVRLAPNDLHGWMGLRGYALAKGDVGTFMRATMAVLTRLSDEMLAQSIEILYELNQIEKANDLLAQADRLGRSGDHLDSMRLLLYQRGGRRKGEVASLVQRLSAIGEPPETVLKGVARYHLNRGEFDEAVAFIERITGPDAGANSILWRAMIGQGRVTETRRALRSFLEENPGSHDSYFLLASIEAERGNMRRAETLLVHALDRGFSNMEEMHANRKLHDLFEAMTGRKLLEEG